MVEGLWPEIDAGRFPIKRVPGQEVLVEADVFADGHDLVAAAIRFRAEGEEAWREAAMEPLGNDRFRGSFAIEERADHRYTGFDEIFHEIHQASPSLSGSASPKISCAFFWSAMSTLATCNFRSSSALRFMSSTLRRSASVSLGLRPGFLAVSPAKP